MTRLLERIPMVIRAILLLAIIPLCVQGQALLLEQNAEGYLWLGAAGVLAFLAISPLARFDIKARDAGSLDVATGARRWVGIALLIAGAVLLVISALTFHEQLLLSSVPNAEVWMQYLGGLGLAWLGMLVLGGIGRLPRPDVTVLLLVGVLAVAVFVRVYQIDSYPLGVWFDEAVWGLNARRVLHDPNFRPIFVDNILFPQLALYTAGLQAYGEANVYGMRLVHALLASVGVGAAYILGRELRGAWFGLAMAALLAVMRWSFNFSRFALPGPETVTFTLITFYFAVRVVRVGRLRHALWFGMALAFGVYFYRPYVLQLVAVGAYLLLAYPFRRRAWQRTLVLGATALIAAGIVLLPLGMFILDRGPEYFGRLGQVSLFNENLPDVNAALLENTVKHLEMFHLRGDNNGRHNLPGEPMLDPVTGALFVLGLFVALREWRKEHLIFLISIGAGLWGGIPTLSFEAPQSLRAICAIVGVIYFGALALTGWTQTFVAVLRALLKLPPALARGLAGAGALAAVVVMSYWNFEVYFVQQRASYAVWREYYTAETLSARFYANYDEDTQFFVSPLIGAPPPVTFLAEEEVARSNNLVMSDPLPLRIPPTSEAVVMLLPDEDYFVEDMRRWYPNANIIPVRPVDYGVEVDPNVKLFTVIELTPEDIASLQGLRDGEGVLYVPVYDNYTFSFADDVTLEIDDTAVESGTPVELAEGNHAIAVSPADAQITWVYSRIAAPEPIPDQYLFHAPLTPNGLTASFFANGDWQGDPVAKRIIPYVNQQIHILPMDRPYSVRYNGYIYAPETGQYIFGLQAIDTGGLDIDGVNVIETTLNTGRTDVPLTLERGWHEIEVRHQDLTGSTRIFLNWIPPSGGELRIIRRDFFCPTATLCAVPSVDA